jgi:hypothetical protein
MLVVSRRLTLLRGHLLLNSVKSFPVFVLPRMLNRPLLLQTKMGRRPASCQSYSRIPQTTQISVKLTFNLPKSEVPFKRRRNPTYRNRLVYLGPLQME